MFRILYMFKDDFRNRLSPIILILESKILKTIIFILIANSLANILCNSFKEYRTDEMVANTDPHTERKSVRGGN